MKVPVVKLLPHRDSNFKNLSKNSIFSFNFAVEPARLIEACQRRYRATGNSKARN